MTIYESIYAYLPCLMPNLGAMAKHVYNHHRHPIIDGRLDGSGAVDGNAVYHLHAKVESYAILVMFILMYTIIRDKTTFRRCAYYACFFGYVFISFNVRNMITFHDLDVSLQYAWSTIVAGIHALFWILIVSSSSSSGHYCSHAKLEKKLRSSKSSDDHHYTIRMVSSLVDTVDVHKMCIENLVRKVDFLEHAMSRRATHAHRNT
jgi:hypothetical protein